MRVGQHDIVDTVTHYRLDGWPLVPNIAGSLPAKAVGFFRAKKSSARIPLEEK
jgi:hypothetical protein